MDDVMFLAKNLVYGELDVVMCLTYGIVIDDIIFLPSIHSEVLVWIHCLLCCLKQKVYQNFCGYCIFGMGTSLLLNDIVESVPTAKFTF